MPWPRNAEQMEQAKARMREAQRKRWSVEGAREAAAERVRQRFTDQKERDRMADIKRQQYLDDPNLRKRISESLRGKQRPDLTEKFSRKRTAKEHRLEIIKQRVRMLNIKHDIDQLLEMGDDEPIPA